MSTYTVTVTREADAWLAQCDQEPTARTWAPTLVALREDTLASVRDLLDAGYSVRDVAGAVGLSPGRVAQIA